MRIRQLGTKNTATDIITVTDKLSKFTTPLLLNTSVNLDLMVIKNYTRFLDNIMNKRASK